VLEALRGRYGGDLGEIWGRYRGDTVEHGLEALRA
jgi:hypothetical protein